MFKRLLWSAVVAGLSTAAAVAGSASSEQYRGCDGYGSPSFEGDGMTELATVLLIFNPPSAGNTSREKTHAGTVGIADCDAALADLPSRHWMRKVSLLRARAIHQLTTGNYVAVWADLDAADAVAAGHDDPFYARSLGWGLALTRAYALRRLGEEAKATPMVTQLIAQRPYNRQTLYTALLALGSSGGEQEYQALQHDLGRLIPAAIDEIFIRAIDLQRFADAVALYPQLEPPNVVENVNERARNDRVWQQFIADQNFLASRGGAYAYALLATGNVPAAQAALKTARERLTKATEPPPPLTDAERNADPAAEALRQGLADTHLRAAREAGKYLAVWERMVALRLQLGTGKVEDVIAAIKTEPLPRSGASVEFLDALQARLPAAKRPAYPLSSNLKMQLANAHPEIENPTPEGFLNHLPQAEIARRLPDYNAKPFNLFGGPENGGEGYRIGKPDAQGVITIRFNGDRLSSGTMVEEVALLHAAEEARKAGKKGFIIVGRDDVQITVSLTSYGTTLRTDPGGFETELRVLFVDPAALPETYKDAPWRVLDADTIYNALAPIYIKKRR